MRTASASAVAAIARDDADGMTASDDSPPKTFVFLARFQCKPGKASALFDLLRPVCKHCEVSEPDTLQYEVLQSDQNPESVLLIERYTSRAAMLEPHKSSAAFQRFKRALEAADILADKAGSSWLSTDHGMGFMRCRL